MADWIESFIADTQGILAPESFLLWTAITTIAGVLERKCWTETYRGRLYPNQFVILCGFPASGKSLCIERARRYWVDTPEIFVGPENPTRKSFLETLQKSPRSYMNGTGATEPMIFCAMSTPASELGVLFSAGDKDFFSAMSDLYDNKDQFSAPRSTTRSVNLERPTVNILGGATPDYLGEIFPDIAWGQGFTSRLIFIYGTEVHDPNLDVFKPQTKNLQAQLQADLDKISKLAGEFIWETPAMDALNKWVGQKLPPVPEHSRLIHYRGRRGAHVLKLCMISAVSRRQSLIVGLDDFLRARKWLLDAETQMPDVFRAIKSKSDEQLILEAHQHAYSKYSSLIREKRQPLPEQILWEFIQERTTSERVQGIIQALYRSEKIRPGQTPGTFVPQPKTKD